MEYQVEKNKSSVKITYTVSLNEFETYLAEAYQKNKGKFKIPGFRPGHAPRKVIEGLYGQSVFFEDAFNACANKSYATALDENPDVFPVDEPKLDVVELEKQIVFTTEVTVKPEVTLGAYTGLEIAKTTPKTISKKEIDEEVERLRSSRSRQIDVTDRALKDGDTANIDYEGSVDGVKFDGGTAKGFDLVIGSHSFIANFEEQLIGMNVNDSKEINVKFPDDYHAENLKGKDAVFAVKLNAIKVKELPELNDEFIKEATEFNTVEEYRNSIKERRTKSEAETADNANKNKMIDAIVANAKVDVPDCMVENEIDYMLQDFEYRLNYMYGGMKIDDYFKYTGTSREDFRKERKAEASKAVKTRLVMETIIKQEKIEVTDADIDAKLEEVAKSIGKTLEEYKPTVNAHQIEHMKNDIVVTKTIDKLVSLNNFVAKKESATKTEKESTAKAKKESTAKTKKDSGAKA